MAIKKISLIILSIILVPFISVVLLLFIFTRFVTIIPGSVETQYTYPPPIRIEYSQFNGIANDNLLALVNKYRFHNNLKAIDGAGELCVIAQIRSVQAHNNFSHDGYEEISKSVNPGYERIGENLATDFNTDDEIINAWKKSPSHNDILLGKYSNGCIVCYKKTCSMIVGALPDD